MKKSFEEKINALRKRAAREAVPASDKRHNRPITGEFDAENLIVKPLGPRGKHRTKAELSQRFQDGLPLSESELLRLFGPSVSDTRTADRISRDKFFQSRMNKMQAALRQPPIEPLERKHKKVRNY